MSLFRFAWRQAWAARGRTLALATGVLVAAVAFVALISTVTTSRLQVHRLAASHFRPAYDILVRPPHSQTHLEATRHLIAENYLSGLFGGITTAQWHEILHTAGVSVAAPIANVGYVLLYADVNLPVPVNRDPVQLYRVKVTWRTYNGLAHFPGAVDYVYVNRVDPFLNVMPYGPVQVPRGGNTLDVCIHYVASEPSTPLAPFDWLSCFSTRNPGASSLPGKPPGAIVFFQFPLLVTGIDPHQEALLLHLPSTVVADRYLKEGEGLLPPPAWETTEHLIQDQQVPVLVSTRSFLGESLTGTVQRLRIPAGVDVGATLAASDTKATAFLQGLSGVQVGMVEATPADAYRRLSATLEDPRSSPGDLPGNVLGTNMCWTPSPVRYRVVGPAHLTARTTTNPPQHLERAGLRTRLRRRPAGQRRDPVPETD
ncbi:MAG: hypothetical protein ACRDZQ_07600 [Acidimicrobiales bacterium]